MTSTLSPGSADALLFDLGEKSLSIAGIVIAGFAVGGLFYTFTVSRMLPRLGVKGMICLLYTSDAADE